MSLARRTAVAVLGVAAVVSATAGTALAAPGNGRSALPGSVPSWAQSAHKARGSDPTTQVDFRVYLANQGGDAATAYATAASTPGNALYRQFLTSAQYRTRFSPTQSDANAVSSWLKSQGFTVGHVPANRKYVEAVGTVAQAAAAFGTSFSDYTVDGTTLRSNDAPLTVPSSLGNVEAVIGLDESMSLVHHDASPSAPPPAGFRSGQPCSTYWGEKTVANDTPAGTTLPSTPSAFAPCGYAGAQLQGAYGVSGAIASGNNGKGVTVAVIDAYASPTAAQDLATYSARHGLPPINGLYREQVSPGTYIRATNSHQDPGGWSGEETLDIEAVHTMAPGANILYVSAPNNYRDLDATLNHVVDSHSADIVTNSYGYGGEALPKGYIKPQLDTQIQAAATGISVFFSSGDSGDETGGVAGATPTPDWPASSPFVTAVGGTSLGVTAQNTRLFELGWETGRSTLVNGAWSPKAFQYGSGGGTSRLFAQPSYQAGVVPAALSQTYGGSPMRVVPDVSALGDPTTGMAVGQTQTFSTGTFYDEYRIGGTSLSSPLYAGMWALAVQNHGPYGLANPTLYQAQSVSYDITKKDRDAYPGAVRVDYKNGENAAGGLTYTARWFDYDEPLTIHVRPGYDDVTGVGSPAGAAWLAAVSAK